ncbi:MAG: DUF4097 family beta strand repeat-containing protein [Candidatus Omnitrophota bacterium]
MKKSAFSAGLAIACCLAAMGLNGCLSATGELIGGIGELIGGVAEGTASIVEAAVEVPVSVAEAAVNCPPEFKSRFADQQEWTLDRDGASFLSAETSNGSICLTPSPDNRIVVKAWKEVRARRSSTAEDFARKVDIRVERNGREIRIYKAHPKIPQGVNLSVRYEIQTPPEFDAKLDTSNGAVHIAGLHGDMDIDTSNGKVELEGVVGRVRVCTSNGAIVLRAERLDEESELSSSNGSIEADIYSLCARLGLSTSNGSIHVKLPLDFNGKLDAVTSNGSVGCDFPITVKTAGRSKLIGILGDGRGPEIRLRSSNGGIRLKKIDGGE